MILRTITLLPSVLFFLIPCHSSVAQSIESVTSQKERCLRKLEKVERSLETVVAGIERVRRLQPTASGSGMSADAFIDQSRSKVEYLNNRIERARNQLEKIESDLQGVQSGNQCPKCLTSDVNLFCRHCESLFTESSDLVNAVNEFDRSLRGSVSVTELCRRNDLLLAAIDSQARVGSSRYHAAVALQEKARTAITSNRLDAAMAFALEAGDSAATLQPASRGGCALDAETNRVAKRIETAWQVIDGGSGSKAAAILEKAAAHFEKGKKWCAAGKTDKARTELTIAEKFTSTAIECAGRKE